MRLHRLWLGCAAALALVALSFVSPRTAVAIGINDYRLLRTFELPAYNGDFGNVLFDVLPDGRLLLLNGSTVSVETAPRAATFTEVGPIPGFGPAFGASFLSISPDGTRAAAGSNAGGTIVVFNTSDPSAVTTFNLDDFTGEWYDNRYLAVASGAFATPGVSILDTQTGVETRVIADIGGASAGVTFDSAGNLYTANGLGNDPNSKTGWIKSFALADWQNALATNTPVPFKTSGALVADLLSAHPIGFDGSGNMYVGGADFFGGSGDLGYAALVAADAVASALANPQATPPINGTSPGDVLRKFPVAAGTIDTLSPPNWNYNPATEELYINYIYTQGYNTVSVYGVPEPSSMLVAAIGGVALIAARRRLRGEA